MLPPWRWVWLLREIPSGRVLEGARGLIGSTLEGGLCPSLREVR